jgi:lysophospholipase L1-like esterase
MTKSLKDELPSGTTFEQLGQGLGAVTSLISSGYSQSEISNAIKYVIDNLLSTPNATLYNTIAFFGDSRTALDGTKGRIDWGMFYSRGALRTTDAYNFGVIADTTSDLLARIDNVIAASPDLVHLAVGINDLVSSSDSVATIYARYEQIVNELNAAGIAVSGESIATTSTITAAREVDRVSLNALIAANENLVGYCGSDNIVPATDFYDGVHYNAIGASKRGADIGEMLLSLSAEPDIYDDVSDNLCAADLYNLTGTAGGKYQLTGDVATHLNIMNSLSTVSVVASKGVLNGATSQVLSFSRTGGGSTGSCTINIHPTYYVALNGLIGERYELVVDFKVNHTTGLRAIAAGDSGAVFGDLFSYNTSDASGMILPTGEITGVMRTGSKALVADVASTGAQLGRINHGDSDIDFTVEIGRPYIRRVY